MSQCFPYLTRCLLGCCLLAGLPLLARAQQTDRLPPVVFDEDPFAWRQQGPLLAPPGNGDTVFIDPPMASQLDFRDGTHGVGQTCGFGRILGIIGNADASPLSYSATWIPDQRSGNTQLGVFRQSLLAGAPVWTGDEEEDRVVVTAGARNVQFNTDAIFPNSGRPFPDSVWNIAVGGLASYHWDNDWTAGVLLTGGSASDRPFHSINEATVTFASYLRVPTSGANAWLFSVLYSNLSQFPYPFPGVAYQWQADDDLLLNVGIPFQVYWRPSDVIHFELSYLPVTTVHALAGWTVCGGPFTLYLSYDWASEAYFLVDRTDQLERFYAYAQTLSAVVRYKLPALGVVELGTGYAFDRYFFNGRTYADRDNDHIGVAPGVFLTAQYRLMF
ncbi:MAG: hypothetical protein AB7O62_09540 [Pirellulales bacterium]